jgi:hypothetical protein
MPSDLICAARHPSHMADEAGDQDQAASAGKSVRFVELSSAAMTALLDGSLAGW